MPSCSNRKAFLSILDDTATHHERNPPAQVDIPGTEAMEGVGFQAKRGKVEGETVSYKLHGSCEKTIQKLKKAKRQNLQQPNSFPLLPLKSALQIS